MCDELTGQVQTFDTPQKAWKVVDNNHSGPYHPTEWGLDDWSLKQEPSYTILGDRMISCTGYHVFAQEKDANKFMSNNRPDKVLKTIPVWIKGRAFVFKIGCGEINCICYTNGCGWVVEQWKPQDKES